ncbi:magnesium transporter CorA family protein [Gulosibacter bifidus]|uniref:Magnesium transporter CorA family protein n=1 Tax=Gulosibacter bifidus TaxID=272239 RepID=A0ABW5RHU3_9MICO|nr:magnesium transporter CorA family protein [Gulosibacter bifidus]
MPSVRLFEHTAQSEMESPQELVQRLRANSDAFGWIDLTVEEVTLLHELAELLDLHELAVEDALSEYERPKLGRFTSHQVLTLSASTLDESTHHVSLQRFTGFVFPQLLVSVREPDFPIDDVAELITANLELSDSGVAFLLWAVLDTVVDDHAETLELIDDATEDLSVVLFAADRNTVDVQHRAYTLRRSLAVLQHATFPLRDVVNAILRRAPGLRVNGLEPYFSDVYDHIVNTSDWADSVREHLSSVLDTNLALQSNQMNETMKQVTSWAAIIAVPTAITGYFGQNLDFPGFGSVETWWVSNAIIVAMGGVLYAIFKRNKWL